jgi:hypothetical protein
MANPPEEPIVESYESLRMTSDDLSVILGLPFDDARQVDKENPSLKWQIILTKPSTFDLSQQEIRKIETYLVEYENYLKKKSLEEPDNSRYENQGGAPGYYNKNDGYGGAPRFYRGQENNRGGQGGAPRYYGNAGNRGGSSLENYPGSGKQGGWLDDVANGAIGSESSGRGGADQKGNGWTPYEPPASSRYENDFTRDYQQRQQERQRQKERQNWQSGGSHQGGDTQGDDPPPPPEPDDYDDGGPHADYQGIG